MAAAAAKTRATIFDVAEAAGVSITTVSHVFSGKRRVHEETRARVIVAAERLSYRPRASARALAAGRTNTLALSIPITGPDLLLNSFFARLLPALSLAALERGYSFLYVPRDVGTELSDSLLEAGRVDGAVLVVPAASDPLAQAVVDAGTPYVSVGPMEGAAASQWVGEHPAVHVARVLAHLDRQGYERPGLLSLEPKVTTITSYEDAFRHAAGADVPIAESAHVSERDAYDAALAMLAVEDGPDALLCLGDMLAVGALRAAADLGLRVPDDLGIVSILDSPVTTRVSPELTATDVREETLGHRAIELLDLLLRGEGVPDEFGRVPACLVARASTSRR